MLSLIIRLAEQGYEQSPVILSEEKSTIKNLLKQWEKIQRIKF